MAIPEILAFTPGEVLMRCIMLFVALSCWTIPARCIAQQNALLAELATEDQAVRHGEQATRTDEDRIRLVHEQLVGNAVQTPADQFHAALVLQHSPLGYCEGNLVAKNPDNYRLAHLLATRALERGYEPARALVAMSIDRYLTFTTGVQRYGTNRLINPTTGVEELVPIDRHTTDAERALYGIAPLAVLLRQFPERSSPTRPRSRSSSGRLPGQVEHASKDSGAQPIGSR